MGWAKEGEAEIASLFRCSLTTAKPNAVDKTATELMKMLYVSCVLRDSIIVSITIVHNRNTPPPPSLPAYSLTIRTVCVG